jgi:hypothetical protein
MVLGSQDGIQEWVALGSGCTKKSVWVDSRRPLEAVVLAYYVCRYDQAVLQTLMWPQNNMAQLEDIILLMNCRTEKAIVYSRKMVVFNLLLNSLLTHINM